MSCLKVEERDFWGEGLLSNFVDRLEFQCKRQAVQTDVLKIRKTKNKSKPETVKVLRS